MVERMTTKKDPLSLSLLVCFQRNNIVNLFRTMFAHKVENDSVKHLLHFFQTYPPFMYSHIHRLNFKGHQMARYNRCEIPHPSPPLCSLFSPRRWISGNCRNETRYECKWNERSNVHILSSAMLWNLACIFTSLSLCARLFNQIKIDRLERRLAIKIR